MKYYKYNKLNHTKLSTSIKATWNCIVVSRPPPACFPVSRMPYTFSGGSRGVPGGSMEPPLASDVLMYYV